MFFVFMIVLALGVSSAYAQEEIELPDAGTTPDSRLFYGLELAFEKIQLAFTAGDVAKAEKGLEFASERLAEVKLMIEQNKVESAEKAKKEHNKILSRVESNVADIEKKDAIEEIKEEIKIEVKLKEHRELVEQVNSEIKIKIEIEGDLTAEQQALINSILDSIKDRTGEVKIKIEIKKDEIKIKIKQETGKTDEEVEDEIRELEEQAGLEETEVKVRIVGNQAQIKIENKFLTDITERDAIIEEIISRFTLDSEDVDRLLEFKVEDEELKERLKVEADVEAGVTEVEVKLEFTLDVTDRDAIINEIVLRSQLTVEQIEAVLEFEVDDDKDEDDEIEIEVEIKDGKAEVEIEFKGDEQDFVLLTTDREEILAEIASRLGVSVDAIRDFVEFDVEGDEEEEDECEIDTDCEEGEFCDNGKCEELE